jgi:hypothetical protein
VQLVSRQKLNHRGAVATIIGIPLALALYLVPQTVAGGDTVNVHSSNQSGGITANQVYITPQPGQLNGSQAYPDKEMLGFN